MNKRCSKEIAIALKFGKIKLTKTLKLGIFTKIFSLLEVYNKRLEVCSKLLL